MNNKALNNKLLKCQHHLSSQVQLTSRLELTNFTIYCLEVFQSKHTSVIIMDLKISYLLCWYCCCWGLKAGLLCWSWLGSELVVKTLSFVVDDRTMMTGGTKISQNWIVKSFSKISWSQVNFLFSLSCITLLSVWSMLQLFFSFSSLSPADIMNDCQKMNW